jgi:hypothetical protein
VAFTSSAAGAAGNKRMQQIRDENALEIEAIKAHLIAGLGRAPLAAEVISAEVIAATSVRAKRLRMSCKDDSKERRLLSKLMVTTPFGMVPAPPVVPPKIQILGPKGPGRTYQVAEKGDVLVTDEATAPGEAGK